MKTNHVSLTHSIKQIIFNVMILYNVTVKVEVSAHEEWLTWMKDKHIQDVVNTGCFTSCRLSRMLAQNEEDGITYSIQYLSPSMKDFHRYQVQHAPALQKEHTEKFTGKFVAFRTMMELEQEFFAE